jgi:hypothetical protein
MNQLSKTLFGAALMAMMGLGTAVAQDKTAGVIDYELNAKFGRPGGDGDGSDDQVITLNQHFSFSNGKGKLTTDRPAGGFQGGPGGGGQGGGRNGGGGGYQGGGGGRGGGRMGGMFGGAAYVDLTSKKYLQVMRDMNDTTKYYYAEEDYTPATGVDKSDKTKKIAGYECKKATVTIRDESFTVWYTTDLPFSYSPINGLLPDGNGVVLAAESNRRTFTAKKVDFKAVAATDVALPANAEKITTDQMRDKRRDMMQRMREQRQQQQNQNGN